jgi:alkylation response protein AidB-like acyl-CoA dehydrogenase
VREREIFGETLATSQGVRWKLADMFKDIEAAVLR